MIFKHSHNEVVWPVNFFKYADKGEQVNNVDLSRFEVDLVRSNSMSTVWSEAYYVVSQVVPEHGV